jgi:hypothetical protein
MGCFQVSARRLIRAKVEEVDGAPSAADLRTDLESKGNIHVSFRYITNFRPSENQHNFAQTNMLRTMGAIPEKALKGDARSHQATYIISSACHLHS